MRVMVIYAHPLDDSFNAVLHRTIVTALRDSGHSVDDCDLYAEGFNPVLGADERRRYHDESRNQAPVQGYVDRIMAAEALVFCHPTWCFGLPAILKGFLDRVFMPGVSFTLENGKARPALTHIKHIAAVVTYGRPRYMVRWMADPPRRIYTRYLYWLTGKKASRTYLPQYHMNVATEASCKRFIAKVDKAMRRFGNGPSPSKGLTLGLRIWSVFRGAGT
jgi:putative NADPH-quinone reductase